MHTRSISMFAAGLALLSGPAALADPASGPAASAAAPATAAPAADPNRLICIRRTATTGSILAPRPECHTVADWKGREGAPDAAGIENTQQFQSLQRPTIVGNPTGG